MRGFLRLLIHMLTWATILLFNECYKETVYITRLPTTLDTYLPLNFSVVIISSLSLQHIIVIVICEDILKTYEQYL